MSEIKVFREKTVSRIIDKRREQQQRQLQEKEESRKQDTATRRHWLEDFKQKRAREIVNAVDKHMIVSSIPHAMNDSKVSFRDKKQANEHQLRQLTADLEDSGQDHVEIKRDSGQYTMAIQSRTEGASTLFEFKSGEKKSVADCYLRTAVAASLHRIKGISPLEKILSNNNTSNQAMVDSKGSGKGKSNDHQIAELMKDLFETSSDPNCKRQLTGQMKRIMSLASRTSWSDIRMADHPQKPKAAASAEVPPTPLQPEKEKFTHNSFRTTLVSGCFVVGPDKKALVDFVRSKRTNPTVASSGDDSSICGSATSGDRRSTSNKPKTEDAPLKVILEPKVLFNSEGDEPAEMAELLPHYCFPSGAEVTLSQLQDPTRMRAPTVLTAVADKQKKPKKKMKVFFPSDFSLPPGDSDGNPQSQPPPLERRPSSAAPATPAVGEKVFAVTTPALSSVVTTFVFILGDHTSQRFCVGMQIPVSFVDAEYGVSIETNYTLCILTRFPFYNYFFYVLFKLDEERKLLSFPEPLPLYDRTFPIHPDLKTLDELVTKLRKLHVPVYPYFILERLKGPVEEGLPAPPENYFSYLPNIKLALKLKNAELDVMEFHRGFYQMFYTNIGLPAGENDSALLDSAVRMYDKNITSSFVPTLAHRQEKDKEESFFTLQWALPTLLRHLPLDQIILALGCAVSEMNIIVKHKDLHVVSSVILALMHLLKPLRWCSPVIVSLPDHLSDILESPVPIILGVQKLPHDFLLLENCVVIDPLERIVHLNPTDVVKSHTILLPSASRVVHALRPHTEIILRFARKQKAMKYKKLSVNASFFVRHNLQPTQSVGDFSNKLKEIAKQTNLEEAAPPTPSVKDEFKSLKLNVPIELSVTTEDCALFLGAIKQFAGVVYNHILAIVNTSIQIQLDEKKEAKSKRRVVKPRQSAGTSLPPSSVPVNAVTNVPPAPAAAELAPGLVNRRPSLVPPDVAEAPSLPPSQPHSPLPSPPAPPSSKSTSPGPRDRSSIESKASIVSSNGSVRSSGRTSRPTSPLPSSRSRPSVSPSRARGNISPLNTRKVPATVTTRQPKRSKPVVDTFAPVVAGIGELGSPASVASQPLPRSSNGRRSDSKTRRESDGSRGRPMSVPQDMSLSQDYKAMVKKVDEVQPANPVVQEISPIKLIADAPAAGVPAEVSVPVPIPIPEPPAHPFNDALSDVTTTDFPDDKSVGGNQSVNASISSGASSLPSLPSDAPMLALKDIGQSGMKFVKKLVDTQMYSNYCQWNKSSFSTSPALDGSVYRLPGTPLTNIQLRGHEDGLGPAITLLSPRSEAIDQEVTEEAADSLMELFTIILSGCTPVDSDYISSMQTTYNRLYSNQHFQSAEELLVNSANIEKATRKVTRNSRALRRYIDGKVITRFEQKNLSEIKFNDCEFLACNGLQCNGFCNTVFCGEICANIWEKRVQVLRRQQAAYNIICKKYAKHDNAGSDDAVPKIEYVTASGARLEAFKHGRETSSQYHLRKAVIVASITSSPKKSPKDDAKATPKPKHRKHKQKYNEQKIRATVFQGGHDTSKTLKPRTFAVTNDAYTLALAKYLAKKETKYTQKYRRRCFARIQRFLKKFVVLCRKLRFLHSVIFIQANIRGYLVRAAIEDLVESLLDRKRTRLTAAIRIRNFVRNHADTVIKICERRIEDEARRLRALNTIQVGTKSPRPEHKQLKVDVSSSSQIIGIAADGRPSVRAPLPTPTVKFLNEPNLADIRGTGASSNKGRGSVSGIALPPPGHATTHALDSEDHEQMPVDFEPMPSHKKAGMAEKAREFLQFGKIVRKSNGGSSFLHKSDHKLKKLEPSPSTAQMTTPVGGAERRPSLSSFFMPGPSTKRPPSPSQRPPSPSSPPAAAPPEAAQLSVAPVVPLSVIAPESLSPSSGSNKESRDSLEESRREMINAVLSPSIFPVINAEYDSNDEEDPKYVTEKEQRDVKKKTKNRRFSRRFSSASDGDAADSTDGMNSMGKLDSIFGQMEKEEEKPSEATIRERRRQEVARTRERLFGLTAQRSKDGSLSGMSDNEKSNRSYPLNDSSCPSDEETIISATPTLFSTSTAPMPGSRTKKSTPFGRYAESKNIAIHSMVTARTPRTPRVPSIIPPTPVDGVATADTETFTTLTKRHSMGSSSMRPISERYRRSSLTADSRTLTTASSSGDVNEFSSPSKTITTSGSGSPTLNAHSSGSPVLSPPTPPPDARMSPVPASPPPPEVKSPVPVKPKATLEVTASEIESGDDEPADITPSGRRNDDLDMDLSSFPLKTLGHAAADLLNRQQMAIIKKMWKMLREGVPVTKHGRAGAPKPKALLCDLALTKLYWRNPGSKPEADMDADDDEEHGSSGDDQALLHPNVRATGGFNFFRRNPGKAKRKAFTGSADTKRMVLIRDIISVNDDWSSDVLQRSISKGYLTNEHTCIITVVMNGRTVDIEVDERIWADLFHGLQIMVNYYQMLLPSRHSSMSMDPDLHYVKRKQRHDSVASQA